MNIKKTKEPHIKEVYEVSIKVKDTLGKKLAVRRIIKVKTSTDPKKIIKKINDLLNTDKVLKSHILNKEITSIKISKLAKIGEIDMPSEEFQILHELENKND